MKNEWSTKKSSKILFYKNLVTFLNEHVKEIQLHAEEYKQTLIEQLARSGSFLTTHGTIAKLNKCSGWTDDQVERLCSVAEENSQVLWILNDEDVSSFYRELVKGFEYKNLEDCATKRIMNYVSNQRFEELAFNPWTI